MGSDQTSLLALHDYARLLTGQTLIIDVRAPIEFAKGSLPGSINLPLMNDEERHLVGTCYKQEDHNAAVALGHELVSGDVKAARVAAWVEALTAHPDSVIMCFRGGMRSRISQGWASEALGRPVPRIEGGYKAMRTLAMSVLENPFEPYGLKGYLIGGHTGAGKTPFINNLPGAIDLEGLANHRGSAFGGRVDPQPEQATFENHLAGRILAQYLAGQKALFFEHESRAIGRIMIPHCFMDHLNACPLMVLSSPIEDRVERTYQEYILDAIASYEGVYGDLGYQTWAQALASKFDRIKKRLGLVRYNEVMNIFNEAVSTCRHDLHKAWIEDLLTTYYDPMYAYQRDQWKNSVLFEGDAAEVNGFIHEQILKGQ